MPEEFLWDIRSEELPDEAPAQPAARPRPALAALPAAAPAAPAAQTPVRASPPPLVPPPPPFVEKRILIRGQRVDLVALGAGDFALDVALDFGVGGASVCCLGLLEDNRLAGDDYFVFENHPAASGGCCRLGPGALQLGFDLTRAPASLHRFLIVSYTDAQRGLGAHGAGALQIRRGGAPVAEGAIAASDLGAGACAAIAEIYRRNSGWRLGVLLTGFTGDLGALLRLHGAEVQ